MNVLTEHVEITESGSRRGQALRIAGFTALFLVGCASVLLVEITQRLENQGIRFVSNVGMLKVVCLALVGLGVCALLIRYSEVGLALFFLIGLVKGDERLASTPIDLTVLVAVIVEVGVLYQVFVKKKALRLPREYFFFVPFVAAMLFSLLYAPSLMGGLDKILRFLCLTSIGILAPFVLFDDFAKVRRFFIVMILGGIAIAINSLAMLGGEDRMVSPSGLNTELGAAAALAIILIWGMLFPRLSLPKRLLFYPVLVVLGVALIGSGGRFANVSAVVCLALGVIFCRKLLVDILIVGGLGVLALPFMRIPYASIQYLGSLVHPSQAMGTRNDLLWLGVRMFSEHPIFGVGVQGYRYLSPNPYTYNYPHNLFLEIGSEMGLLAMLAFAGIVFCAFREMIKQLSDASLRENSLIPTVFLLLVFVFMDAMVSGDINDLRFMWFIFGLPYVLRNLESSSRLLTRAAEALRQAPHILQAAIRPTMPAPTVSRGSV
jgi:O-antigen ligase